MPKASQFDAFMARFKHRRTVRTPIATDVWTFADASGKKRSVKLSVGKPRRVPGEPEWYCEVRVSGWMSHVIPAIGVGPLDSLDNAMTLIRGFERHVGEMHIKRRSERRSSKNR